MLVTLRFGILVFPNVQQLDLTGPYEVMATAKGVEVELIWKDRNPVIYLRTYSPGRRQLVFNFNFPGSNITRLPAEVTGRLASGDTPVAIKDRRGELLESAIPKVTIVKAGDLAKGAAVK